MTDWATQISMPCAVYPRRERIRSVDPPADRGGDVPACLHQENHFHGLIDLGDFALRVLWSADRKTQNGQVGKR